MHMGACAPASRTSIYQRERKFLRLRRDGAGLETRTECASEPASQFPIILQETGPKSSAEFPKAGF